jgi:hypothetical protein
MEMFSIDLAFSADKIFRKKFTLKLMEMLKWTMANKGLLARPVVVQRVFFSKRLSGDKDFLCGYSTK